jgi:hypothetical protein
LNLRPSVLETDALPTELLPFSTYILSYLWLNEHL